MPPPPPGGTDRAGRRRGASASPPPDGPDEGRVHDVLVIGSGPAGASCAYWLAEAGWDVAVVEKKRFPREKTCGDGLTPRAVRQLEDMGLGHVLTGAHRYTGLRSCAYGRTLELPWPEHPSFPSVGYVITRHDLDRLVADHAAKAGATMWPGTEAVEPLLGLPDDPGAGPAPGLGTDAALPACRGAVVRDTASGARRTVEARYVVVADGANSRFGRALGATRQRDWPLGMALRGYYRSPRHDDTFIESHLDVRDPEGNVVPGYGWIFPLGDGRVNVGVGLLSVEGRWKGLNTTHLLETFVRDAPASWQLSSEVACGPATGGKLPMGLAVGPRLGPNVVVAGDAAGSINPFNGEGIAYGYETGRFAAASLGEALAGGGYGALAEYEARLQAAYGLYYKVARQFVRLISRPEIMRACVGTGMRAPGLMAVLLRIMANLMRPDRTGAAEAAYAGMETVARLAPAVRREASPVD
jgi:menaquinone-9 beta-reductase